jgi:hypothetical protein
MPDDKLTQQLLNRQILGNVDLYAQPKVKNPDGTTSTVDSRSYNIDGMEVLLPAVTPDGRHLQKDDDIIAEYKKTGRHLGKFTTPAAATKFAKQLHLDYAAGKYDKPQFSTAEKDWRDMVNVALPRDPVTGLPPHPPMFRKEPTVVGSELGRTVQHMLNVAPELRGQVRSVVQGPTRGSADMMIQSGFAPTRFDDTTLLGVTDMAPDRKGEIGINPKLSNTGPKDNYSLKEVLGHEFAHAVGYEEPAAQIAGDKIINGPKAKNANSDLLRQLLSILNGSAKGIN